MTQFGSAGGVGISYGVASPVVRGAIPISATGVSQSSGSALASIALPVGAMSDFSLRDAAIFDPFRTRVVASSEGSDVSGSWTRYWISATAPTEFRTGNGDGVVVATPAKYAAPQIKFLAVPNNEFHYIDAVQFEKSATTAGTPTAYEEPRTVKINMRADRVNLARNPNALLTNPGIVSQGTMTRDTTVFKYGPASWKLTANALGSDAYGAIGQRFKLIGGKTYTWSLWVYSIKDTTVELNNFFFQEDVLTNGFRPIARGPVGLTTIYGGSWNRISATGTLPTNWTGETYLIIRPARTAFNTGYDVSNPLWFSGLLVEEGPELRDYFDGSFASVDYIWENGAFDTTNGSRSHLYKAFRAKQYRIDDIISKHVPHGTPYKITYAAIPAGL